MMRCDSADSSPGEIAYALITVPSFKALPKIELSSLNWTVLGNAETYRSFFCV